MKKKFLYIFFLTNLSVTANNASLMLHLKTCTSDSLIRDGYRENITVETIAPSKVAIIICDMWPAHWCKDTAERCYFLAKKINNVITKARDHGVLIIHAPAETVNCYPNYIKQRQILNGIPLLNLPKRNFIPKLPIRSTGCVCVPRCVHSDTYSWSCEQFPTTIAGGLCRENLLIQMADNDLLAENATEIYSFIKYKGVEKVFICGVSLNACVMHRPFGIEALLGYGINVCVIRDLVEISIDEDLYEMEIGFTEQRCINLKWIETYWCPTIDSKDLVNTYYIKNE